MYLGGGEVNIGLAGNGYYCPHCDEDLTNKDVLPQTVFDRITASPEVLAAVFVGTMYNRICGKYLNYSMLTGEWYATHAEAIAATLAKLKEACK